MADFPPPPVDTIGMSIGVRAATPFPSAMHRVTLMLPQTGPTIAPELSVYPLDLGNVKRHIP